LITCLDEEDKRNEKMVFGSVMKKSSMGKQGQALITWF
jgi:hypothetical protein